jgi:radical SAM superfamily enzyme YgiQ (UPF0313 family)
MDELRVVLISTYELGRQPFGLASPAAWLRQVGCRVGCLDLAVQSLDEGLVASADLVAFYVPMHTATRLAATVLPRVKRLNSRAHVCFYGLYAPMNAAYLKALGVDTILGGEFESGLAQLAKRLALGAPASAAEQVEPYVSLARQAFVSPDRTGLPPLSSYAHLVIGDGEQRSVGYTEASRGCKHVCRHCPIPPVYGGRFRVVQRDVVLGDIAQQVHAGAQHITFGDADFFNGPGHAIPIVRELHRRWPRLTYDVTIKIEHLLRYRSELPILAETGCAFVTSAVEAVDDEILALLDKRHTRADFVAAVAVCREVGLALNPTFVTFSPWTSLRGYLDLLHLLLELDMVENVSPIQYAIRLLIPHGSHLLELPFVASLVDEFDPTALCYPWRHPDARVDELHASVLAAVKSCQDRGLGRRTTFSHVWRLAHDAISADLTERLALIGVGAEPDVAPIPHLTEPWYC